MRGSIDKRIRGALASAALGAMVAAGGLAAVAAPTEAHAQGSYSPYDETASAALARYVREIADKPNDFSALIGAGRSAVELGDAQAAAGFFARADAVNPKSPLPQAGMASVAVLNGEPQAALPYFARAQQLGAPVTTFACDRGLAYDLLGRQAEAQADYRLALNGPDAEEARRRLALSLAIGGNRTEALALLGPLMAKGDAAAARARAFVVALTGDPNAARIAIEAAMPGSGASVQPFLQRLAALNSAQKAAAVNLGIFPDQGSSLALVSGGVPLPNYGSAGSASLTAGIPSANQSFSSPSLAVTQQVPVARAAPPVQYAVATPAKPKMKQATATAAAKPKLWLQLASGSNADALPDQFRRMKSRHRSLFDGISGYVAKSGAKARLVIGPFRGSSDAEIFAEDLDSVGIDAFRWTNSQTDRIVPLGTE
jgi:Flp pilus assembly protein TadD